MAKYIDLGDEAEDTRIDAIGKAAMAGHTVAFVTDSDPGKADRYIRKLITKFPQLRVIDRFDGPVPNTVSVKVSMKKEP